MTYLTRFLTVNRVGRKITTLTHGRLFHRGWSHPLRFAYGCWLCREVSEWAMAMMADRLPDMSSIRVSGPVFDEDGKLIRHGVSMTATAKRQLEAIMADPEKGAVVQKVIDEIAREPGNG